MQVLINYWWCYTLREISCFVVSKIGLLFIRGYVMWQKMGALSIILSCVIEGVKIFYSIHKFQLVLSSAFQIVNRGSVAFFDTKNVCYSKSRIHICIRKHKFDKFWGEVNYEKGMRVQFHRVFISEQSWYKIEPSRKSKGLHDLLN